MTDKWNALGEKNAITHIGLEESLLGGQSFSWSPNGEKQWVGVIGHSVLKLRWNEGQLEWSAPNSSTISEKHVSHYLWLDSSYRDAVDSLPWRSDSVLRQAINEFSGLRILRQPIDETLFVFLLSSAKSIPQIKHLREKTYQLLGDSLEEGIYAFPGWERILTLSEKEARQLGMGYRAKYVLGVAQLLAPRSDYLKSVVALPYFEAKKKLMDFPGVGPKVADCVLLFGGNQHEAFPIDTWILKSLEAQYGMKGWKIAQMLKFAQVHFGKYAGLAQQFLFSFQRKKAR